MTDYDALIIGAGISGIQTAIDLGDLGHNVLLIDKQASIGGTMIALSKVFPTLDCASCITTPKMSKVFNHPKVDTYTKCELLDSKRLDDDTFEVKLLQKAKYVDQSKCTGCNDCSVACPAIVTDTGYDSSMGYIAAVGVPFATALPQRASLDIDNCILCGRCAKACPTQAIDFSDRDKIITLNVGAMVIATGFNETPIIKEAYGGGKFTNVITGKQMERILAPTGPAGGIFRPSDGKSPWSVAFVQCAGSRDETIGVPYCSSICCMFALKQAMLLSGGAPLADITIYYMDIRSFGKGHEEFAKEAKDMGINFVRGKVAKITENEEKDLEVEVEVFGEYGNGKQKFPHDMVVLSLGVVPQWNEKMADILPVNTDQYNFITGHRLDSEPGITTMPGVFAVGTAVAPMDIVDSIVSGTAMAGKVSLWLKGGLRDSFTMKDLPVVMR